MYKFILTLKNGDLVHTISAGSYDEAVELFCFGKKLKKSTLFTLYDVKKV